MEDWSGWNWITALEQSSCILRNMLPLTAFNETSSPKTHHHSAQMSTRIESCGSLPSLQTKIGRSFFEANVDSSGTCDLIAVDVHHTAACRAQIPVALCLDRTVCGS